MKKNIRSSKFVEGWMDMSPRLPAPRTDWIKTKFLDIPYSPDPEQRLDLYLPNETPYEKPPLLVIFHGGGFSHMDKRDWHVYPGFFALREGFAVASANYRLAPKHKYPAQIDDGVLVLDFLSEHAEEYGYDKTNVFLEGTSAGGNLVIMLALMPEAESYALTLRGVAPLCPVASLTAMWQEIKQSRNPFKTILARKLFKDYLGVSPEKGGDAIINASADKWLDDAARSKRYVPPFYFMQGDRDPAASEKLTREFVCQMRGKLNLSPENLVYDVLKGAGHAGAGPEFFDEGNLMRMIEFFKGKVIL